MNIYFLNVYVPLKKFSLLKVSVFPNLMGFLASLLIQLVVLVGYGMMLVKHKLQWYHLHKQRAYPILGPVI